MEVAVLDLHRDAGLDPASAGNRWFRTCSAVAGIRRPRVVSFVHWSWSLKYRSTPEWKLKVIR
jgi:hypothetical protein